jgi:hypothetical protein
MDKLRTNITTTLQQLGEQTGNYATPWTVTYKILQQRTHCRFKARLRHAKAKSVDRLCILDVLSKAEMQLYWYIVKEYSNKNKGEQV